MASKPKFNMRTPAALAEMQSNTGASSHSQFDQLTDSEVRNMMKANNEVPEIQYFPRDVLEPLPFNDEVYGSIDSDSKDLLATAKDIAEVGIQEPLVVYKSKENGKYVIISGNRRFAASDLAKKLYPDQYKEIRGGLPCIVQPAPEDEVALKKRMIKNNLQREKTPYVRMREIAVYNDMISEEQSNKGGESNVREVICDDLGVTTSEITRFLKISNSLIAPLMDKFEKQLLSTNVAHQLASASDEDQEYIAEHYDFAAPLTNTEMHALLARKALSQYSEEKKAIAKEPKTPKYQIEDIQEGFSTLVESCNRLQQLADMKKKIKKGDQKRLLKKINAELEKIDDLKSELEAIRAKAGE